MAEYIERQVAIDAFNRAVQDVGILDADDIETVFGMLSSADVVQVVHAHWIDGYRWQTCSKCRNKGKKSWKFCPNCGAKMDGEKKE